MIHEQNFKIPFQVKWSQLGGTAAIAVGTVFVVAASWPLSGAILAPAVASNLVTRYAVKIAAENKVSDLQRNLLVFGVSSVLFAATGLALAVLGAGTPVVATVLSVGLIIAALNTLVFAKQKEVDEAREEVKCWTSAKAKIEEFQELSRKYVDLTKEEYRVSKEDLLKAASSYGKWSGYLKYVEGSLEALKAANTVFEKLNEFHTLCEEYAELSKADYFLSRETLKDEAAALGKDSLETLKYIESRLADLKTAVVQQKELTLQRSIDRKIEGYCLLWEDLKKPKDCMSFDDLRRKCQSQGFYSAKSEELLNIEFAKLTAKARALGLL